MSSTPGGRPNDRVSSDLYQQKKSHIRDLSLVLLGVALTKADRTRVTDSLPFGSLPGEIDDLINAIRENDGAIVKSWFLQRGAVVENGKDAIQATIDAIKAENERTRVKSVLGELAFASKILDRHNLIAKLKECAAKLEELG